MKRLFTKGAWNPNHGTAKNGVPQLAEKRWDFAPHLFARYLLWRSRGELRTKRLFTKGVWDPKHGDKNGQTKLKRFLAAAATRGPKTRPSKKLFTKGVWDPKHGKNKERVKRLFTQGDWDPNHGRNEYEEMLSGT